MKKFIAVLVIACLCLPAGGLCGVTNSIEVGVWAGATQEVQDIYGWASIPLIGLPEVLTPGQTYSWKLSDTPFSDGVEIRAENNQDLLLGTIGSLELTVNEDPMVTLGFSVTAGSLWTAFSFSSPVVSFSPITNPTANAGGSISLGSGNSIYGSYSGKIFKTLYNTGAGGTTFKNIVASPPGWEVIAPQTINNTVSDIQIKSAFLLSPGGIASGGSSFEVVIPEPATICLLGLGGLLLGKKRNK